MVTPAVGRCWTEDEVPTTGVVGQQLCLARDRAVGVARIGYLECRVQRSQCGDNLLVRGAARGGRSEPNWNANSGSTTRMRLPVSDTASPMACTKLFRMRPGSGPLTLMWACPAALVAAIFHPISGWALTVGHWAWIAWPPTASWGRKASGRPTIVVPAQRWCQSNWAASWSAVFMRVLGRAVIRCRNDAAVHWLRPRAGLHAQSRQPAQSAVRITGGRSGG